MIPVLCLVGIIGDILCLDHGVIVTDCLVLLCA